MAANFKSHVLLRDEKGFFGIPFKRLLLTGVSGGMGYTLVRMAAPELSVVVGVVLALAALFLTGLRGGLPLWQRLLYRVRGAFLLSAAQNRKGVLGQVAHSLDLPLELVRLDAAVIFAPAQPTYELDMREWVSFARTAEADRDDGLVFVSAPMTEALH